MLFLILGHLLQSLDLRLQVLYLLILLFYYPLQIHHPLQRYLIRLLALIIMHRLLQPLDHFVRTLQL
jgi:hypothetical protein